MKMFDRLKTVWNQKVGEAPQSFLSRRELFRQGGALSLTGLSGAALSAAPAATAGLTAGPEIYESIGVRPVINCRGTFTIISGSLMLPEARAAMVEASQHYVHLDELMDGIGARLAELTKAEWGMISSGCAAGLTHATSACLAGGNPDMHVRIPNLEGFPKDEVIIPTHSRNVYDAAVRATGVRILEVETQEDLESAIGPRTAMIYILAGPNAERGPLAFENVVRIAKPHNVPILVDAAAEILTIPNAHLTRGATLVAYSGGKCIRGPQTAGLILGRKDLVKAAWVHSAPHHGFARSMKVGKEEAIAMLMAVEMWLKRDHEGEWNRWLGWLDTIDRKVKSIPGVSTKVEEPKEQLSNRTPALAVRWDAEKLGLSGQDVAQQLLDGEPRIVVAGGYGRRNGGSETGINIVAYMMQAGNDKVVADRLHAVLSKAPGPKAPKSPAAPSGDLSGRWDVTIEYLASKTEHTLMLDQKGNSVQGLHEGNFVSRNMSGAIDGSSVTLMSAYTERHGDSLNYRFTGTIDGDTMSGDLDLGEYRGAKWTAHRQPIRNRG